MAHNVETTARNMRLTDNVREYVEKKAAKLYRHLNDIDEVRVDLEHDKGARSAIDREVAQITVRGKGFILRTEERADDIHAAFDTALDKIQRQVDKYKGKRHRGRGDGRSAAEVADVVHKDVEEEKEPLVSRRKTFAVLPMTPEEAVEQMRYLGHDNFFIFFNPEANALQVMYRRRDGTYGLIEPTVG